MWRELRTSAAERNAVHEALSDSDIDKDGTIAAGAPRKTLMQASLQIVIADVSMSLDNVLAVAGAARDHPTVLFIGLILSIALMGIAANYVAQILNRYPWIAYVGLAIILYVAARHGLPRRGRTLARRRDLTPGRRRTTIRPPPDIGHFQRRYGRNAAIQLACNAAALITSRDDCARWPPPQKNQKKSMSVPRVSFVSLGCPKALVDSERILTRLRAEGYEIARKHDGADLVVVNTCGFLDSARDESLKAIGDALSENGRVIVTGCLGAEPDVIRERHPNVLAITGPQAYESVMAAVHEAAPPAHDPYLDLLPPQGVKLTPRHYAYLKISEGCNNRCSFCIIPALRGDLVSRPIGDVLREAERLATAGVKEILVISQDTSAYGVDIKYQPSLWKDREVRAKFLELARELGELGSWIRMHYVYPYPHVDEVIPLMAEGKILPYLDIPFQHASPAVLKNMRRPAHQEKTLERIRRWREQCPDLAVRSTFIVGFPGETEEDFEMLLDWLDEARIDRAGCFKYEPVRGARSNDLGLEQVPQEVKEARWHRFMAAPAEDLGAAAAEEGRQAPAGADRRGAWHHRPRAVRNTTRRRSTAASTSSRGGRCAPARSSRCGSTAPTPTICTARRSELSKASKRIDDAQSIDLATVRHVFGMEFPAACGMRGRDDGAGPKRETRRPSQLERGLKYSDAVLLHGEAGPSSCQRRRHFVR